MEQGISIFWFRRDIRLEDNHGLYKALEAKRPVLGLFIFDRNILDHLPAKDARVQFIHQELQALKQKIQAKGGDLIVRYGKPEEIWPTLIQEFPVKTVYANRDYEPYGRERDQQIYDFLKGQEIDFIGAKDQVLMEKEDVLKDNGEPYVVYTPFMKRYKSLLREEHFRHYPSEESGNWYPVKGESMISLQEMGFESFPFEYPARELDEDIVNQYHQKRDLPAVKGTSRLSLHLRFGTISIRRLAHRVKSLNEKYFNELIWRDFYQYILYHYPHTQKQSFRPEYDRIEWENNEEHFKAWCAGKTGYPLVDAGMRELNESGFMHNRVRMLVASFLTKHLLIDWRWGEAYFAEKLLDFDSASNVGGWQWAAGSGVDAAPYFRVFNPALQLDKFDKDLKYVKRWVPEYGTSQYPEPIVEHKSARLRAIERYKMALKPES